MAVLSASTLTSLLCLSAAVTAFPQYRSLAGLSKEQLAEVIPTLELSGAEPPPPPLNDTSAKLVNDADHPWMALTATDIRGPCPGLNTLASHGWINRSGVDTPGNIVRGVQEGFNMGNDLAVFITYAAMLVDGNQLTNLMSIGSKTNETGAFPPAPAIVGGLDTHAVFEGDASLTRGDFFFGDNHDFNETLFDEFTTAANQIGAGSYNETVAAEYRFQRIQESIATNPNFTFVLPRFATAYAEAAFPFRMFVDGRVQDGQLSVANARGFFQNSSMPDGFFRRNGSYGMSEVGPDVVAIFGAHPVSPGGNQGINNFVPSTSPLSLSFCAIYTEFVNVTVRALYPDPTGDLKTALNENLDSFFSPLTGQSCTQIFPFAY